MTYEYVCTACSHHWEAEQSISEAPLKDCPSCGQASAKRQISGGAGFILKGGGWYADLYSSSKPGKKDDAGSETKKADATPSSSTSKDSSSSSSTASSTTTTTPTTPTKASAASAS